MLRSMDQLIGYNLLSEDEQIGKCKDILFDERFWTVRHILADTGGWLFGKQVLIAPWMIESENWGLKSIFLNISREQLEKCPGPEEDQPVSREHERELYTYFGYPYYWAGTQLWGAAGHPAAMNEIPPLENRPEETQAAEGEKEDNYLRSFKEVKGYGIQATDGDIGHVQDFILDDVTWAMRYVVVDTRDWLPGGKKVLLSLNWVDSVSWASSSFSMNLSQDQIKNAPEYDPKKPVNMEYEVQLYDYYGRPFEKTIDKELQKTIANPFV